MISMRHSNLRYFDRETLLTCSSPARSVGISHYKEVLICASVVMARLVWVERDSGLPGLEVLSERYVNDSKVTRATAVWELCGRSSWNKRRGGKTALEILKCRSSPMWHFASHVPQAIVLICI